MLHWRTLYSGAKSVEADGDTGLSALRQSVAREYGDAELFDHYYCIVARDGDNNEARKPDWLFDLELVLNNSEDDSSLSAVIPPLEEAHVLIYPSPPRMINRVPRPLSPSAEVLQRVAPYFDVEIYTPHQHYALYQTYSRESIEENKKLVFTPRLTAPGGIDAYDYDSDRNVVFLAMRHGAMIGYCDCKLLFPRGGSRPAASGAAWNLIFGDNVEPGAIFEVVGLSALRAHGGYQIALILLYHAFQFVRTQSAVMPVTHLVSHSASIVTKTYLCGTFGFSYNGRNYFSNDDFIDTIAPDLRVLWSTFLQQAAQYLLMRFKQIGHTYRHGDFDIALRVYQLALWFRRLNSKPFELLVTLLIDHASGPLSEEYLRGLVEHHLQFLSAPEKLDDALHRQYLYLRNGYGLTPPQGKQKKHKKSREKTPATFGYDELLRVALHLRDDMVVWGSSTDTELSLSIERLINFIMQDVTKRVNYTISYEQLEAMEPLLRNATREPVTDALLVEVELKRAFHDEMEQAREQVFGEEGYAMYDVVMNTVLDATALDANLVKTARAYERGETKNFVPLGAPVKRPVGATPLKYPDEADEIRALMRELDAVIKTGEERGGDLAVVYQGHTLAAVRDYYDNLFIKLHLITNNLDAFKS